MRTILLALLLFVADLSYAQSNSDTGLEIFHRQRKVTKTISLGSSLVVMYDGVKLKGKLEAIDAASITVGGQEIPFRDIVWIGEKTKWSKSLAIGMAIVGLGIATAGVLYLATASGAGILSSGLILGAGAGTMAISRPLFAHGKRFYLDSEWKITPPSS